MKMNSLTNITVSLAIALSLSACGGEKAETVKLQGAGASFPAPLYLKWFKSYSSSQPNVQVDYQSVGSGSGVKSFMDRTVDFAASDAAMKPEDIAKVDGGVQLLPMTAGSIVLAHSLKEVPNLKLSREAYAGIFSGKITKWNDPAITSTNPDAKLPDAPINVIVRADSSGTTFVFTKHLSTISPDFAKSITSSLLTTPGSIGYIEYGYAHSQKLPVATLQNKAGNYVEPTTASATAALASAEMPADLIAWVSDPEGKDAYPIVTYTWMLFYKKYENQAKAKALRALINYGLTDGRPNRWATFHCLPKSLPK
jgi:phosphate transport system substrate-binding protein